LASQIAQGGKVIDEYWNKMEEMEVLLFSEMKRLDDPYRLWNQEEK
jgi:hypothetical protein